MQGFWRERHISVLPILFILCPSANTPELPDRVRAGLPKDPRLYIGASRLPSASGVMVRALGGDELLLRTDFALSAPRSRLLPQSGAVSTVTSANALVPAAG